MVVPVEPTASTPCWCASTGPPSIATCSRSPAGKRDVEGEAPETTASRELDEEIGRRPGRLVKLCEFYNSPGFSTSTPTSTSPSTSRSWTRPAAVNAEEPAMTVERVALDDVDDLIADGRVVDAKSIIGLLLLDDRRRVRRFAAEAGVATRDMTGIA